MGQCMSRKAAGAFAASAAASHNRPTKMSKNLEKSPDDENNKELPRKTPSCTKGVAMSFGFKRRPIASQSVASNATAARRLATAADIMDRNGNEDDTDPLTTHIVPSGRSTPRLAPPKKEPNATTRVSRFGYRDKVRLNKVADLNGQTQMEFGGGNINVIKTRTNLVCNAVKTSTNLTSLPTDNNRNRVCRTGVPPPQIGRFTLQSTQLPRPEPIRVIETKTAKTLANNNRKISSIPFNSHHHQVEEVSSKDGSSTEDSGVGSHLSGYMGDADTVPEVERLESSPTFGARRNFQKPRNLEVIVTGNNTFDVKDFDDSSEGCAPLPQLPSAFNSTDTKRSSYQNTGIVRERTVEYQRLLDRENRRKISVTSSEGFSDDYGEEEKTLKERFRNEKPFMKSVSHKTFLKSRTSELRDDSSPPSSDEHEWTHGGEAMADEISCSLSSSDESKDRNIPPVIMNSTNSAANSVIGVALQNFMTASTLTNSLNKTDVKSILLTIEDPKFAAVAAASKTGTLLDDETLLSPVDISYSESEDIIKRKLTRSSSNSKDINEKLTPPSPGTPTNASNSLSLSDGKDDFLIDDEIADQPDLLFEDTIVINNETFSISQNNSENTPTIVDSTPKPRRKPLQPVEGSPLIVKNKKFLESRAGSLDTLSTCDSIASDDMMMDFEYSQSSGLEDCDRQSSGFPSLNETIKRNQMEARPDGIRDWSTLFGNFVNEKSTITPASRTRLLRSRTSTPNSVSDSPRSLESIRVTGKNRPSATSSPVKPRFGHLSTNGYDSDDSIRLDRANHTAMKQDIISIKTMLLKLRRVLNEQTDEDALMRSESHNSFECQAVLTNGLFNSLCPTESAQNDEQDDARLELAELRRQVLFLQGQLEDKEKTVQTLQEQMVKLSTDMYTSNSAPASTITYENNVCNAATQTERVRPISAGPSLLNGSSVDGTAGSLVSATETSTNRRSRPPHQNDFGGASKRTPSRLWRKPGEPPSPQRYATTNNNTPFSIPRRSRTPSKPS